MKKRGGGGRNFGRYLHIHSRDRFIRALVSGLFPRPRSSLNIFQQSSVTHSFKGSLPRVTSSAWSHGSNNIWPWFSVWPRLVQIYNIQTENRSTEKQAEKDWELRNKLEQDSKLRAQLERGRGKTPTGVRAFSFKTISKLFRNVYISDLSIPNLYAYTSTYIKVDRLNKFYQKKKEKSVHRWGIFIPDSIRKKNVTPLQKEKKCFTCYKSDRLAAPF